MRIVQAARRFVRDDWGGAETVIFESSRCLLAAGHHTEVLCTMATAKTSSDNFDGLQVHRYPYFYPYFGLSREAKQILDKKGGSPFSFQLMRALKRFPDLDLIHLHTGNRIGGIGRHVAMKRRIPYVVSLHGGVFDVPAEEAATWTAPAKGSFEWGKALGWWVGSRRILEDAGAILCVGHSEKLAAQENLPHKRVIHLPNGVDSARFASGDGLGFREKHGIPAEARVLLTVARIDPQKNQLLPVRMLPELRKADANTHVLLIGNVTNPSYHEKIEKTIDELGVRDHVTVILGIAADSEDLQNAYHAADVFLLPSIHEPFGIVVLEAWAAGKPVIASDIGGIPHFVENGVDGLLFVPHEDKDFVEAYRAIVSNGELAQSLAKRGCQKAREHFDWTRITQQLVEIYEEVRRENTLR